MYVYIEIKTSDMRAVETIQKYIKAYKNISFLIKGLDRWFSPERKIIAHIIYRNNRNVQLYERFRRDKDIRVVKLYKRTMYRIWNRW